MNSSIEERSSVMIWLVMERGISQKGHGQKKINEILQKLDGYEPYTRLPYIYKLQVEEIKSSGFVVDTLEAALWCVATTNNYQDCVLKAVNLGNDTDTVSSIAGGLAGIVYGYEDIPIKWIEVLANKELIDECLF